MNKINEKHVLLVLLTCGIIGLLLELFFITNIITINTTLQIVALILMGLGVIGAIFAPSVANRMIKNPFEKDI